MHSGHVCFVINYQNKEPIKFSCTNMRFFIIIFMTSEASQKKKFFFDDIFLEDEKYS